MRTGTVSRLAELQPVVFAAALFGAAACTDAKLEPIPPQDPAPLDRSLQVSGAFCADGADDLAAVLKILVIVDRSNSMRVTDPGNRRVTAVQQLLERFVADPRTQELQAGTEMAVVGFFGDVVTHTRRPDGLPGFSADGRAIQRVLPQLAQVGANTSYEKALAQAFLLLDLDMARLPEVARGQSRYEVVFLSDGMPFPEQCAGESNAPTAAVRSIERLRSLSALHRVRVRVHTAFASDPRMFLEGNDVDQCGGRSDPFERDIDESVGAETRALLQAMATAGGGTYTQFESGDAITFAGLDFPESRRVFGLSGFLATNQNARPTPGGGTLPDTDGDGIDDAAEILAGTEIGEADTDGDGHSDALELNLRASGLDPLDPSDARCDELSRVDTDGDGLRDCEELLLGTLTREVDSDFDGLPDAVELAFGGDPVSADPLADQRGDADEDGGSNAEELRWHTDPFRDDVAWRTRLAYRYSLSEALRPSPAGGGRACYDFQVDNITLAGTQESSFTGREGAGWNRVLMYFAQSPFDDPLGPARYRMACADARYFAPGVVAPGDVKVPANGRIAVPERRPSDTWRPSPVLRPDAAICSASVDQDCGLGVWWCRQDEPTPAGPACLCRRPNEEETFPCPACSNGIDDDGDGQGDFPHDPDCASPVDDDEADGPACGNGIDDDGDGLTDWPDEPGCASLLGASEAGGEGAACSNGEDDDGDGVADFPEDPDCSSAADDSEDTPTEPACADGEDNDGDGLVDLEDEGCDDALDGDEAGPGACFYCQRASEALPGQCLLGLGQCRARSGTPAAGACTSSQECRGAPCVDGVCRPCVEDSDCRSGAICEPSRGWCLEPAWGPNGCGGATPCEVDGRLRCRGDEDCGRGERCDDELGYCLARVFEAARCDEDSGCDAGACDDAAGWCLPALESEQCRSDADCPLGSCVEPGYCEQPSFVAPEDFRPELDCWR